MKKITLLSFTLLLVCALAPALPAQQVTYTPNYAASDFSGLGTSGGTATIRYDLVGSPSSSPYGASFDLTFNIGAIILNPGATSDAALSYFTPYIQNAAGGIVLKMAVNTSFMDADGSDLQQLDLSGYPRTGFDAQTLATIQSLMEDGTIKVQYTAQTGTTLPIAASGWGPAESLFYQFESSGAAFNNNPSPPSLHLIDSIEAYMPEGGIYYDLAAPWVLAAPGTSTHYNFYFLTSTYDPATAMNRINLDNLGPIFAFTNLSFSPVPEPGGAVLLMSVGMIAMLRRRRR